MPATPAPLPQPVLTVEDLSFGYQPSEPIIHPLSASLLPGQLCVMLGPNAAGKSTLLRLMLGMHQPWTGQVRVAGRAVADLPAHQRAAWVSYVPQHSQINLAFTVEQVVAMGRLTLPSDPAAIEQALADCDLLTLRGRPYHQLSTGQQQRVLLARALAQAAGGGKVVLMDEPGSGMDLSHLHRMMQQLVHIAQQGLAVLAVLHDLNLAARYADVVWLLAKGRLAAKGPWQQVLCPQVLAPVYQVRLATLKDPASQRPVFAVHPKLSG